jgi:hypothetical protein
MQHVSWVRGTSVSELTLCLYGFNLVRELEGFALRTRHTDDKADGLGRECFTAMVQMYIQIKRSR